MRIIVRWRRLAVVLILLVVPVCLYAGWPAVGPWIGGWLTVSPPAVASADHVLIWDGDRAAHVAAEYYMQGKVRRVVLLRGRRDRLEQLGITQPLDEVYVQILRDRGVPADRIVVLDGDVDPPRWNLEIYAQWRRQAHEQMALVLCSQFSARVVHWSIWRFLPERFAHTTVVVPLRDRRFGIDDWWKTRSGVKHVFYAFFDLAYYCVRGPDRPLARRELWDVDAFEQQLARKLHPTGNNQ